MSKIQPLKFTSQVIYYPLLFLFSIVFVFWVESRFNLNFNYLGILPRELIGLRGIFLGPFIHSDVNHLFNNSIPLFVLGVALFYFYPHIKWKVMIWGLILTGLLTWTIGRPALHIGASGVIYMLTAFLMFKGIFSRQYQLIALSFAVVFLYGSFLWYVFPIDPKISWEGHLSGLLVGFLFSILFRTDHLKNRKYAWEDENYNPEDDAFLRHFDEDGNFIEKKEEPMDESGDTPSFRIHYTIKKSPGKDSDEGL
jgi:membrane associated rhomboid family serine protease